MSPRRFLSSLLALALATTLHGSPASLAPDFTFPGIGSQARSLRGLKGQPVVLLIADSPSTKAFRVQLKELRRNYSQFASRQALFMVAFRDGSPTVESNVPFVVVNNGAAVADRYGVKAGFNAVIIGIDGNLEYQTAKTLPPARILDVIQNGAATQSANRKEIER